MERKQPMELFACVGSEKNSSKKVNYYIMRDRQGKDVNMSPSELKKLLISGAIGATNVSRSKNNSLVITQYNLDKAIDNLKEYLKELAYFDIESPLTPIESLEYINGTSSLVTITDSNVVGFNKKLLMHDMIELKSLKITKDTKFKANNAVMSSIDELNKDLDIRVNNMIQKSKNPRLVVQAYYNIFISANNNAVYIIGTEYALSIYGYLDGKYQRIDLAIIENEHRLRSFEDGNSRLERLYNKSYPVKPEINAKYTINNVVKACFKNIGK